MAGLSKASLRNRPGMVLCRGPVVSAPSVPSNRTELTPPLTLFEAREQPAELPGPGNVTSLLGWRQSTNWNRGFDSLIGHEPRGKRSFRVQPVPARDLAPISSKFRVHGL